MGHVITSGFDEIVGEVIDLSVDSALRLARLLGLPPMTIFWGLGRSWERYNLRPQTSIQIVEAYPEFGLLHCRVSDRQARLTLFLHLDFVWSSEDLAVTAN